MGQIVAVRADLAVAARPKIMVDGYISILPSEMAFPNVGQLRTLLAQERKKHADAFACHVSEYLLRSTMIEIPGGWIACIKIRHSSKLICQSCSHSEQTRNRPPMAHRFICVIGVRIGKTWIDERMQTRAKDSVNPPPALRPV